MDVLLLAILTPVPHPPSSTPRLLSRVTNILSLMVSPVSTSLLLFGIILEIQLPLLT